MGDSTHACRLPASPPYIAKLVTKKVFFVDNGNNRSIETCHEKNERFQRGLYLSWQGRPPEIVNGCRGNDWQTLTDKPAIKPTIKAGEKTPISHQADNFYVLPIGIETI